MRRTYTGSAQDERLHNVLVTEINDNGQVVDAYPLPLCLDIVNHSPTGFAWGYLGSGPAQLSLAILYDHFKGNGIAKDIAREEAIALYHDFKFAKIAIMPMKDDFVLDTRDIQEVLNKLRKIHYNADTAGGPGYYTRSK